MVRSKNFFMKFYLALIIAFLYIPIAVLVVLSFNDSRSRVVWGGFTLEWYKTLFHNSDVVAALQNTLTIGFGSALIATVIGVLAAVGIDAMKKRSYSLTLGVGNIPMLNADIVTGIALMLWFSRFTNLGYVSILLAHVTFNIPYVILSVLPKLQQMDMSVYEAARDLGAGSVKAFTRVILPNIFPAVVSGFFMAVTMSMDDFVVTYFTKGAGINTLSTMIYGELKRGIKPEMYALSTLIFASYFFWSIICRGSGRNKYNENFRTERRLPEHEKEREKKSSGHMSAADARFADMDPYGMRKYWRRGVFCGYV